MNEGTKLLLNGTEVTVPLATDPDFETKIRAELARAYAVPKATESDKTRRILSDLAGAATAVATVLPEPGGIVARVIAAALGVASAMLSQGATPQQAVDAIKRVRHIDTRADDAAVDAQNAAKPSRDAGIPAKFLRELGTADTVPAPRAELRPVMVAVPVEAPKGAWSEPGEGD